jgi:hypothetical protein
VRTFRVLNRDAPINVLLFDSAAESMSAPTYWQMALATGGSLLAPAEDWR